MIATIVSVPAPANCFDLRIKLGAISGSRLSSAIVVAPVTPVGWSLLEPLAEARLPAVVRE
jgi:hypothetical protein